MIEEIKRLHLKYETLVNYANERQGHCRREAKKAEKRYKKTGNVQYYQEAEGHKNMSLKLLSEVRAYKVFKMELEEILNNKNN